MRWRKRALKIVRVRGVLENALPPEGVDAVFDTPHQGQYQRKLLFSTIVQIRGAVVFRVRRRVNLVCMMYLRSA